jgi:uncharacterized protein with HEPN domain
MDDQCILGRQDSDNASSGPAAAYAPGATELLTSCSGSCLPCAPPADAIRSHLRRGTLADGLVFDAVWIRLLEIGEAVKVLPGELLGRQPDIPWSQISRMRDHLSHRYFDTAHTILQATVDDDLPELERAVRALSESLDNERADE